jgi:uncharacterized membrane protein
MEPALVIALWWVAFAGTHVGLATMRDRLAGTLGARGFDVLFSGVAFACFGGLIHAYASRRFAGAPGLGLARLEWLRLVLLAVSFAGAMLAALAFTSYFRSPYALFNDEWTSQPRGVERITRHPFFVGVAMIAVAHALLATRLVGTTFATGLLLFATIGSRHQDRKLLARRGEPYAAYLAATSMLPFAAILAGRQRLVASELPLGGLIVSLGVVLALCAVHDDILAHGGLYAILFTIAGVGAISLESWRIARRRGARSADREGDPAGVRAEPRATAVH